MMTNLLCLTLLRAHLSKKMKKKQGCIQSDIDQIDRLLNLSYIKFTNGSRKGSSEAPRNRGRFFKLFP